MGRKKNILDSNIICEEYLNTNIGIEALASKYHTGKLAVKKILTDNGIEIKARGSQLSKKIYVVNDWKIEKFPKVDGYYYIAKAKDSDYVTNDYMNNGGHLTSYIKKTFNVSASLYDRRMYYMTTGNYWWEQWFDITKVEKKATKRCPYCNWETEDIDNKSGAFEQHLLREHNKTKADYLKEYPDDNSYFIGASSLKNRQLESDTDKFVVCQICGKKLARIDSHHLKTHGITKREYISKYGFDCLTSKEYHSHMSKLASEVNMKISKVYHSSSEQEIMNFIKSLGFDCYTDRKILKGQEIDIFIPELNIGIEYNGNAWHTEVLGKKDKNYHLNKTLECAKNGITLFHIFEDEYELHKDIVLSKIKHLLNKDDLPKVYARKCNVKLIDKQISDSFLNRNHIQGEVKSTVYLGCYYNNELIGVMTFLQESKQYWNLTRFATSIEYNCIGVGGKLFSYFKKNYDFVEIKSFLDRRWCRDSKNNLYTQLGFKFDSVLPPDYRYYNSSVDRYRRFHKFGFRKTKLLRMNKDFNDTLTELQMTRLLGYERIWDCGLIKYVYK